MLKNKNLEVQNKNSELGKVYVYASFNNTLITATDNKGQTISWGSSGKSGFKGTRKATPYAATTAVESVLKSAKEKNGIKKVEVFVKGPGPGRDAALRGIRASGIEIVSIADTTPVPFDGPRPKKRRRV